MLMTIEELEEQLNKCQKALAELKGSKKEGKWKPKNGEMYWFINDGGEKEWSVQEDGDLYDEWRYDNIPIFKIEEECERYKRFMDTVKEKSYEFSKEEWESHNVGKYTIYYVFNRKEFGVDRSMNIRYFGEIYFKTEEDAQYIIDNFKEELLRYWL